MEQRERERERERKKAWTSFKQRRNKIRTEKLNSEVAVDE